MSYDLLFTDEEVAPSLSKGEMHISVRIPDTYYVLLFLEEVQGESKLKIRNQSWKQLCPYFNSNTNKATEICWQEIGFALEWNCIKGIMKVFILYHTDFKSLHWFFLF